MPNRVSLVRREWDYLIAAIMFYTRFPTPANANHSDLILNRSRKYFPLIGLFVGGLAALVYWLSSAMLATPIAIVLTMISTVLATGAFHEDGFADTCDGFGGGWDKEHVLTIMKDSRLGTYGAIGLFAILALKFALLFELSHLTMMTFGCLLLASHALSRQLSSSVIEFFDYVQDIDQSKVKPITDQRLCRVDLSISIALTFFAMLGLLILEPLASVCAVLLAAGGGYIFARYSRKRIGGYTGDVLGAIQQIAEVLFYTGFLLAL